MMKTLELARGQRQRESKSFDIKLGQTWCKFSGSLTSIHTLALALNL